MRWYADWLRYQMQKLSVAVRYRCRPSVDDLRAFDAVVLATGGKVARPDIPGIDSPIVCTFEDILRCGRESCEFFPEDKLPPTTCGDTVLIWGDHFGAADAAEKLGVEGKKIYVVTQNRAFAEWMEPCHRDVMMKRFACGNGEGLKGKTFRQPVTIIPHSTVIEISDSGDVTLMDQHFRKTIAEVNNVVLGSVEPDRFLHEELVEAGIPTTEIGDRKQVRNLRSAVTEAANAGLTLDEGLRLNANLALVSNLPTEVGPLECV
jgi:hypothetical protein